MRSAALLLLLPLALLAPGPARAQVLPSAAELNISLSPEFPHPYDTVTATVSSNQIDLAAAAITISVNGKAVAEGDRNATFSVGGAGTKTVIAVVAKDSAGTHDASITLHPEDVSVVVEPSSSVPPFYKGARLPASEGNVRLIALADFKTAGGAAIAPSSLVYTWKFGDKLLESSSGIGKSVLTATGPVRYRDADITVTVSTQDKTLAAQESAFVSPVDPVIRIYRNDPLEGIDFSKALSGTLPLMGDEETFRAFPFFYSLAPQITWTLNGTKSGTDPDLTVRTTGASAGSAVVGASAQDPSALNNGETRFTVQFGGSRSTGIFGL